MNDPLPPPPWERQTKEPNRWYARFESFRLAGTRRSLLGIVNGERQQRGVPTSRSVPQAWATNARRWRWRERAEAWDACQRLEARAAHAQQVAEMNHRHLQEAKALQHTAVQRLKTLDAATLSPAEVVRFCVAATKLERLALGDAPAPAEPSLTDNGGLVPFTVEDAVRADQALEHWHHDRLHAPASPPLPDRDLPVP